MDDIRPPLETEAPRTPEGAAAERSFLEKLDGFRFDMPEELEVLWDETLAELRRLPARATPQD